MSRGRHRRGRGCLWLFVGAVVGFLAVLVSVAVIVGTVTSNDDGSEVGSEVGSDVDAGATTSVAATPVERADEAPAPGAEAVPAPDELAADVGTDDDGEPTGDTSDAPPLTIPAVIDSIQEFWAENLPTQYGTDYEVIPDSRIIAMAPGKNTPRCDGRVASYEDVQDNAFAAACREGEMVAYDEPGLFEALRSKYGPVGPAVVLAHEWGHVAQAQAGVLNEPLATVLIEQQADCYAGAWVAEARAEHLGAELDDPSALDSTVAAMLEFRDQPGSDAESMSAHGSGFDRVRAFQEGFEDGASKCTSYLETPPTLTQVPFTSQNDFETGGNLPYDDVLANAIVELNEFFAASVDGFEDIAALGAVGEQGESTAECNGNELDAEKIKGYIAYCAEEGSVVFDDSLLREFHSAIGDTSTFLLLALQWAEAAQEQTGVGGAREADADAAFLQQTCMVGGWVGDLLAGNGAQRTQQLQLSAGDVDEAIILFLTLADSDAFSEDTALFDIVGTFRGGVIDGFATCVA